MNSTSTSCTHFAECSTTPAAQNLKIDYLSRVSLFLCRNNCLSNDLFLKNTCDVPESSGTLAPASVEHDELRVISNNAFVDKKGEDEYYIAYGDVSQIWKRQMKSTGQMVCISRCLHLALNSNLVMDSGRNQGIQDNSTCWS